VSVDFSEPQFSNACKCLSEWFRADFDHHWDLINSVHFVEFLADVSQNDRILTSLPCFLDLLGIVLSFPQIDVSSFSNSRFFKLLFESFLPHISDPLPILVILESLLGDNNFAAIEQFHTTNYISQLLVLFDSFPRQITAIIICLMSIDDPSPPITTFLNTRHSCLSHQPPEFFQILQTAVSQRYELLIDDTALFDLLPMCDHITAISIMQIFTYYFHDHNDEMLTTFNWQYFEPYTTSDAPDECAIAFCQLVREVARHSTSESLITPTHHILFTLYEEQSYAVKEAALDTLIAIAEGNAVALITPGYLEMLANHLEDKLAAPIMRSLLLLIFRAMEGFNPDIVRERLVESSIIKEIGTLRKGVIEESVLRLSMQVLKYSDQLFQT
jgi:hypothetical protein